MKFINQSIEIWQPKSYSLEDGLRHAERCTRVCYLSGDRQTDTSYKKFMDNIIKSGHLSTCEHMTVYLTIPIGSPMYDKYYIKKHDLVEFFNSNPYSIVKLSQDYNIVANTPDEYKDFVAHCGPSRIYYITTNYRVLLENDLIVDDNLINLILPYVVNQPTDNHEKRVTVHVITSISVTREWNRHRTLSVSEQSTRWCNFTKDKFNGELTFITPTWFNDSDVASREELRYLYGQAEVAYRNLIDMGWKPEQAREVLPLGLKTEVVYTGFKKDWEHFLELRTAKNAHPNIRELANRLKILLNDN